MRLGWVGKVALGAMIPALVGLGAFVIVALQQVRGVTQERIRNDMLNEVRILGHSLTPDELRRADLRARLVRLAVETRTRITVIDGAGEVLADTDVAEAERLENHGQRPEVLAARRDGVGIQRRHSRTVDRDLLYAAAVVPDSDVVVRLARDISGIEADLRAPTRNFWWVALGVLVIGGVVAVFLARGLTRPVLELTSAARRVEGGDLEARVYERGEDEIGHLGRAFNRMTDRLKETVELAESEASRLTTILEAMDEGVVAVDSQERISFLNGAARRILGLGDEGGFEGRRFYELVRDPQVLGVVQMAADRSRSVQAEIRDDGPPRRLVGLHAAPVAGSPGGVILVLRDMSRLRRLERMRSDFVSNVSHELRTPLATIAAALETLEDADSRRDVETAERFLGMISRNVDRLEALLNDILALSRLESRPETLPRDPVDFAALARTACEELAGRAQKAEIELHVAAQGRAQVLGDAQTLHRVVDNLVVNAINYTPAGGRVEVRVDAENGFAVLRVTDTGIGIPARSLERIFERFYRVDKARSRSGGGTGLGLAITKHAVGLHGGSVDVESEVGKGSTFTARIPLASRAAGVETSGERAT